MFENIIHTYLLNYLVFTYVDSNYVAIDLGTFNCSRILYSITHIMYKKVIRHIMQWINLHPTSKVVQRRKASDAYSITRVMCSPDNKCMLTISVWLWAKSNLCSYCVMRSAPSPSLWEQFVNEDRRNLSVGYTTNQNLTSSRKPEALQGIFGRAHLRV